MGIAKYSFLILAQFSIQCHVETALERDPLYNSILACLIRKNNTRIKLITSGYYYHVFRTRDPLAARLLKGLQPASTRVKWKITIGGDPNENWIPTSINWLAENYYRWLAWEATIERFPSSLIDFDSRTERTRPTEINTARRIWMENGLLRSTIAYD